MKLIELTEYKEVNFYGIKLTIPKAIKYLVVDIDDRIIGFEGIGGAPVADDDWIAADASEVLESWGYNPNWEDKGICFGYVDLEGMDWRDTLVEV